MSEQFPTPAGPSTTGEPRPARTERNSGWIFGIVLLILGGLFLLRNFNLIGDNRIFQNWWALFILIPAIASLVKFVDEYREQARFTHEARNALIGSIILFIVTATLLFGFNWAIIGPALLIIFGLSILLSGVSR